MSLKRHWPIAAYLVLYTGLLLAMHLREGFALAEPLFLLALVGVGFTALALWSTRGVPVRDLAIKAPAAEGRAILLYLAGLAIFLAWILPMIRRLGSAGIPGEFPVLVAKLLVFVGLPILLWRKGWGYRWAELLTVRQGMAGHWRPLVAMAVAMVALQLVFGRAWSDLTTLGPGPVHLVAGTGVTFLWLVLEVGLVEEFFFRVLLQSRLASWTRSELVGLVGMAVLFGLAHAPGLYLRPELTGEPVGAAPSLLLAVGYSIVVTSVTGFCFGVLWLRTRNLLLLAILHAVNDLVPGIADTIRHWSSTGP